MIVVYTKNGCPFCAKIKSELNKRALPFEEREISLHPEEFGKLKSEHGVMTVPTTIVNGKVIIGSDKADEIEREYYGS